MHTISLSFSKLKDTSNPRFLSLNREQPNQEVAKRDKVNRVSPILTDLT